MSELRPVRLPALSATMESATLIRWLVDTGDTVVEGQSIAEVETDKVEMELESPYAGAIATLSAAAGAVVALGAEIASIQTEQTDFLGSLLAPAADEIDSEPNPLPAPHQPPPEVEQPDPLSTIFPAVPAARHNAKKAGIDLSKVVPTGRRGQVTTNDVRKAQGYVDLVPQPLESSGRSRSTELPSTKYWAESAQIPQAALFRELTLSTVNQARQGRSWTTVVAVATAGALRRHPAFARYWLSSSQQLGTHDSVRVGVGLNRPGRGLVVVSLPDLDMADADEADQRVRAAMERCRTGKLHLDDLLTPSMTVCNLGHLGVERFNTTVMPGQSGTVSLGAVARRPVVDHQQSLTVGLTATIGLTVDQRAVDAAEGGRFLASIAEFLDRLWSTTQGPLVSS